MQTIAIIDYGMGNLHSAAKAMEKVADNARVRVSSRAEEILEADRVMFPGVGAIRDCMHELKALGLDQVVREVAASKPLLCVCVGMQAMMDSSEENEGVTCLGLLPGEVKRFASDMREKDERLKVPHMGWNQVHQTRPHPMWRDIEQDSRFYFVHSYYVNAADAAMVAGSCEYGVNFAACLSHENIFTTQFHPEKSANAGLQLLANFSRWDGTV